MRLQIALLCVALAGVVGGAWLIGMWAVGLAVIADSLGLAWWALFHDDGQRAEPQVQPQVHGFPQALERFRDAS